MSHRPLHGSLPIEGLSQSRCHSHDKFSSVARQKSPSVDLYSAKSSVPATTYPLIRILSGHRYPPRLPPTSLRQAQPQCASVLSFHSAFSLATRCITSFTTSSYFNNNVLLCGTSCANMAAHLDIMAPGEKMPDQARSQLRGLVADLLQRNQTSFPGAQPVSFCRRHFQDLIREE